MKLAEFAEPSPTHFYLLVSETEAQQLADGALPENVRLLAQTMIDFRVDDVRTWEDQRAKKKGTAA